MFPVSAPNPQAWPRSLNWVAFIGVYFPLFLLDQLFPHPVMERFKNRISSNSSYHYQKLVFNSAPHSPTAILKLRDRPS